MRKWLARMHPTAKASSLSILAAERNPSWSLGNKAKGSEKEERRKAREAGKAAAEHSAKPANNRERLAQIGGAGEREVGAQEIGYHGKRRFVSRGQHVANPNSCGRKINCASS